MAGNQASSDSSALRHAQKKAPGQQYLTLDVRTKDGRAYGFPYAYLISFELNRSQDTDPELTLLFTSHKVTVKGRNLIALYEHLLSHKLAQIIESDTPFDAEAEEVHVTSLHVHEVGP
jgi:hypothetical protein